MNATGTTVSGIKASVLKKLELPVPPPEEQKIIAERLDSLLAQVATIKARLDAIPALLKRFRQSVLSAAVSGKLTEEWRKQNNISTSTTLMQLGNVFTIDSGVAFKKADYSSSGSRLLQIANVAYGEMKWEQETFISLILSEEYDNYSMKSGDIVMALNRPITNGCLKVSIVYQNDLPSTLYQRVGRFRVSSDSVVKYCLFSMMTNDFRKQVEKNLKGSDQPYINTSDLKNLLIPMPTAYEQTEIVRRVEQLFAYAESVGQQVAAARQRVDKLTQAILAKAFSGELTADWRAAHPDLISGEQSAAALLARIQAERAASAKPGRKPTSKR